MSVARVSVGLGRPGGVVWPAANAPGWSVTVAPLLLAHSDSEDSEGSTEALPPDYLSEQTTPER